MMAMRAAMFGVALSVSLTAPAMACSLLFEPGGPPNETYAEFSARQGRFHARLQRERQQEDWQTADVVFLARVTSLNFVSDEQVRVGLTPIVEIKGDIRLPTTVLDQYHPMFGSTCGPTHYAAPGDLVIVYANRPTWRTSPRQWGQPRIINVVTVHQNRDPNVAVALRQAASRLRGTEK
jgi:hypothetical protein